MASVAAGPQNPGNVNYYFFHIIVFLCIAFLFGKLDPIAPLTPFGMNTIGVFLGVIYAWVFIDIIWPSMVGLLALMLLDVLPATALLNKGFGDPTVIMMMFIFVFSATLDRYGLAKYISLWFVSRKCVMGKPWRLTFALLLAIAILGGLTSATPAAVIGWSLLYGVFDICGYKKGDGYPIMMIIGTVFAAQLGMSLVPFKSLPLVAISAYEKLSGTSVDYALYLLASLTTCLFLPASVHRSGQAPVPARRQQARVARHQADHQGIGHDADRHPEAASGLPRRAHHLHDAARFPPQRPCRDHLLQKDRQYRRVHPAGGPAVRHTRQRKGSASVARHGERRRGLAHHFYPRLHAASGRAAVRPQKRHYRVHA